jgi:hypothetical protein
LIILNGVPQALVIAQARQTLYGDIHESTRSITFLGTPHQGSTAAVWATYLGHISQAVGIRNSTATKELTTWSDSLLDLQREFCEQLPRLLINSFFETIPYKGILVRRLGLPFLKYRPLTIVSPQVVHEGSAYLGYYTEIVYRLEEDYRSICKFASATGAAYRRVVEQMEARMEELGLSPAR